MQEQVARVLTYLARAEERSTDPWEQDEYRLSWLTVYYASCGLPEPFVLAHYRVFGIHPSQMPTKLEARRRAMLGPYYELFYPQEAVPPKKPAQPASLPQKKAA